MIRFSNPILLLAGLWILLYHDHIGVVRISILCSLLHELGHILVWFYYKRSIPELVFSPMGIGLSICDTDFSRQQELILAAAGPAVNLILVVISGCVLAHHASYWGYFFMGSNLLTGIFNLLPFGCLDGKRVWKNLFHE